MSKTSTKVDGGVALPQIIPGRSLAALPLLTVLMLSACNHGGNSDVFGSQATATPVGTPVPSGTPSPGASPTPSSTALPTATATSTASPTATPTATATSTPTPGPDVSAMACLNPRLFEVGAREQRKTVAVDGDDEYRTAYDVLATRETSFNGETVIELKTLLEESEGGEVYRETFYDYVRLSDDGRRRLDFGSTDDDGDGSYNDPAVVFRYDLEPGAEYVQTFYDRDCDAAQCGGTNAGQGGDRIVRTIRYLGRETITVPAGQFATCKFSFRDEGNDDADGTIWLGVGNGLLIREEADFGYVEEMTEAAIDGEPVTGMGLPGN